MNASTALFGEVCAAKNQAEIYDAISHYTIISNFNAKTWEDTTSHFLLSKSNEGCAQSTIDAYTTQLSQFGQYLTRTMPAAVSTEDLYSYISYLKERGLKKTTINQYIRILNIFFSFCLQKNFTESNPVSEVKTLREDEKINRALTEHEVQLIRQNYKNKRERAICEFFISTGCRVSEITEIKLSDVNFSECSVKVTGKGDKSRTVYFSEETKKYLEEYLEGRPSSEYLFIGERKPHNKTTKASLEAMVHKLGVRARLSSNLCPHKFRHYFATHLFENNTKIEIIQHLMGHTNPQTTMKYIMMEEALVKDVYDSAYNN